MLTGHRSPAVLIGRGPPSLLSQFLSHSPPSGTVHQCPLGSCLCSSRTVADGGERWPALLESVLGATPREFESPILRHADLRERPADALPHTRGGTGSGLNSGLSCAARMALQQG
jgi:hypothetical protein